MPAWPSTLPAAQAQGYAFGPVDPVIRTDMEAGKPRARRRFTAMPTVIQVSWRFTQAQLGEFETFWHTTLSDGVAEFDVTLQNGTGFATWSARFHTAWRAVRLSKNLFEVSAELISMSRPVS